VRKHNNFEIDWLKIHLERGTFKLANGCTAGQHGHLKTILQSNGVLIICSSGRVVKTPMYLGGITIDNVDIFHQELLKMGVIMSKSTLLNARLSQLDVKKDIHFGDEINLSDAISMFRERAMANTSKYHMLLFEKSLGLNNSLLIKTTTKTTTDSLCIYKKLQEMFDKRRYDDGYYASFDSAFLDTCKDMLRFERRIKGAKVLRRALHLKTGQKVTLQTVFDCPFDILQEKITEHLSLKEIGGK